MQNSRDIAFGRGIALAMACAVSLACVTGCQQQPTTVANSPSNSENKSTNETSPAGSADPGGTAATLDGEVLEEGAVAAYIAQFRLVNGYSDDGAWATFLDESGQTAEAVRSSAIRHFARMAAVEKKAGELGISVSDEDVDDAVSEARKSIGAEDAAAWKSVLETTGYDDDGYRADVRASLLASKLCDSQVDIPKPDNAALISTAGASPSAYTGKKVVELVFPASASRSAAKFADDMKDADSAGFIESAGKAVDDGTADSVIPARWSCLAESPSPAMLDALDGVKVGHVGSYDDPAGKHHVFFVVEEYSQKSNGMLALKDMPDEIKSKLEADALAVSAASAREEYLAELEETVAVDEHVMPSGLAYDVDMSNSSYGEQKTQSESDAEAQKLIDDHLAAAENENAGQGEPGGADGANSGKKTDPGPVVAHVASGKDDE